MTLNPACKDAGKGEVMARKPQRNMPKVPRSNVNTSASPAARRAPAGASEGARAYGTAPQQPDLEQQYHHVRRDLARIGIFGTLIFAVMLILRFVVGL